MIAEYIGLIGYVVLLLPFLGAGGFAVAQAALAKKGLPVALILPGLTGLAALFCAWRLEEATPWGELGWGLVLFWCGASWAGVLAGWLAGVCRWRREGRRNG